MEHDGQVMIESLVVTEYVADAFAAGSPLLPEDAAGRATARMMVDLNPFNYFGLLRASTPEAKAEATVALRAGLAGLDAFLKTRGRGDGPWALEEFSVAECALAPFVQRACCILPALTSVDPLALCDEEGHSRLAAWIRAVLDRPSVRESGSSEEVMVANTERMLQRFAAAAAAKG